MDTLEFYSAGLLTSRQFPGYFQIQLLQLAPLKSIKTLHHMLRV